MELYKSIDAESAKHNESNDCGVIAVTVVSGLPYSEIHAALKAKGRKDRDGTFNWQMKEVLEEKGFVVFKVDHKKVAKSVKHVAKHLNPKLNFMVMVRDHVLAVKGGEVIDWSKDRLHKVTGIWCVIRKSDNCSKAIAEAIVEEVAAPKPVKRPGQGTKGAKIWEVMDKLWDDFGQPCIKRTVMQLRQEAMDELECFHDISRNTSSVQLGEWMKFMEQTEQAKWREW